MKTTASTARKKSLDIEFGQENLKLYFNEIKNYPQLKRSEELDLAKKIREGDQEALNKLVNANLQYVITVAKKYQHMGLSLPDLIGEGTLGLLRAAQKYDEKYKVKFISYAVWWIKQSILEALSRQTRIARLPLSRIRALSKMNKSMQYLEQKLGRTPTRDELSRTSNLPEKELDILQTSSLPYASLDSPVNDSEDGYLAEFIPDPSHDEEEKKLDSDDLKEALGSALSTLNERQAATLSLYYGINSDKPLTLEEIGNRFGITRERVRQIREQALKKLRQASQRQVLENFLSE
jgi:RNA polymerase primary sigma factor